MKRLAAVVALASLMVPAAAEAKGMATVRVCGAEACVTLEDRAAYVLSPAETVLEPPPVGSFYRMDVEFEAGDDRNGYSTLFVPSSGLIASNAGAERALLWYVPRTEALAQLGPAARKLEAFEAPEAWPAAVDAQPVPPSSKRGWSNYLLAGGVILVVLAAAALARRGRRIQPRPDLRKPARSGSFPASAFVHTLEGWSASLRQSCSSTSSARQRWSPEAIRR